MKSLFILFVPFTLLFSACKKSDSSAPGYITANTWQHDSVVYDANSSNRYTDSNNISIVFFPSGFWNVTPNIHFSFYKKLPKTEGVYNLTNSPTKADELGIQALEGAKGVYFGSQGSATCYVSIGANGKLTFRANNVPLSQYGSSEKQTLNYSFNLTEF
ncbi:MAG: hypothetical protein ABI378_14025 [Chitinophagaceae bacterium]